MNDFKIRARYYVDSWTGKVMEEESKLDKFEKEMKQSMKEVTENFKHFLRDTIATIKPKVNSFHMHENVHNCNHGVNSIMRTKFGHNIGHHNGMHNDFHYQPHFHQKDHFHPSQSQFDPNDHFYQSQSPFHPCDNSHQFHSPFHENQTQFHQNNDIHQFRPSGHQNQPHFCQSDDVHQFHPSFHKSNYFHENQPQCFPNPLFQHNEPSLHQIAFDLKFSAQDHANHASFEDLLDTLKQFQEKEKTWEEEKMIFTRHIEMMKSRKVDNINGDHQISLVPHQDNMNGIEFQVHNNEGTFLAQPIIDLPNNSHYDNQSSRSLDKDTIIMDDHCKQSSFESCEKSDEEHKEVIEKSNDDMLVEEMDPIGKNLEDQNSYVIDDHDVPFNEDNENSMKDKLRVNDHEIFGECDSFSDDDYEYIEEFMMPKEVRDDIGYVDENFDAILSDIKVLFLEDSNNSFMTFGGNIEKHIKTSGEYENPEDQYEGVEINKLREGVRVDDEIESINIKNKLAPIEPTRDQRNLIKFFFTDWHDHFIDHKVHLIRFLRIHNVTPFQISRSNNDIRISTNWKNLRLQLEIFQSIFHPSFNEILAMNVHPTPIVRKIFHIAWDEHFINETQSYSKLVLCLKGHFYKNLMFLESCFIVHSHIFFIKNLSKPTLEYKFIHIAIEFLIHTLLCHEFV